jgi:hypothetical protein
VNSDKTYYALDGEEYTVVEEPTDGNIDDYYELTYVAPEGDDAKVVVDGTETTPKSEFYVQEFVPADLNNLTEDDEGVKVPTGWYYRDALTGNYHYNYVRSEDVPSSGSTLAIKFTNVPATTN